MVSTPTEQISIFSKLLVVLLSFPASIFLAGSIGQWLRLARTGWPFWREFPFRYLADRSNHPRVAIVRQCTNLGASTASFILKQGGLSHLTTLFFRILSTEGLRGLRARYIQTIAPRVVPRPMKRNSPTKRVLVSDTHIPRPDTSAGDLTTIRILQDFCTFGYDVVFVPTNFHPPSEYSRKLQELGVTVISEASGFHSPAEYVAHEGHTFSLFYFIRLNVAEYLMPIARETSQDVVIIFHAPDLACLREQRQALLSHKMTESVQITQQRELSVTGKADLVIVLSEVEKEMLQRLGCTTRIELFPALYAPLLTTVTSFPERKDIFFLGGFTHAPNSDAVIWFSETIWPKIRSELPGVSFRIIGADATKQIRSLAKIPGVIVDGFIPDLVPVLTTLRVGVAPLRFGAGIKGKVALTMGAGIPCVCTPIAAEGMGFSGDLDFLLAESETIYSEKVVCLYRDAHLWTALSSAGMTHIERYFGESACSRRLSEILNTV